MRKILIEFQYDGTDFKGYQIQKKNDRTVQGVLQDVLSKFLNEKIKIFASGRTDSGVHAKSQFAHFETSSSFNFDKLPKAIEKKLPSDLSVIFAKEVKSDFHARFSVQNKTYYYMCYQSKIKLPLYEHYALQIKTDLNIEKMKKACEKFVGEHDFTSFCQAKKDNKNANNKRTIYSFTLEKKDDLIIFKICGNGFLHNMVRIIIGTVLDVGSGRTEIDKIDEIFGATNRIYAGKTVKSKALMLFSVQY